MSQSSSVASAPLHSSRSLTPIEVGAALDSIFQQSRLEWPVKLVISRECGAALMAESLADGRGLADDGGRDLGHLLKHGRAWLAAGAPSGADACNSEQLGEVRASLDALGWQASESPGDTWSVEQGGVSSPFLSRCGRGQARVASNGFVCFSQPPALVRAGDDECRLALAALALEANAGLRLARTSIERVATSDTVRAWWQAVVPIDRALERTLAEAAAATWVARESTLAAYRALSTPALARAYLATFDFETFDRRQWSPVDAAAAVL